MDKPADYASGAGYSATPPLTTKLFRAEREQQTGNASRQQKQSELQQSPTYSQALINANLCNLSNGLSSFQRCLSELQQHIDTIRTSIDSSILLLLRPPPHTTNISPSAAALSAAEPEPSDPSEEKDEEEEEEEMEEEQQLKSPPHSEPKSSLKDGEQEEQQLESAPRSEPKSSRLELKFPPRSEPKSSCLELKSPPRPEPKSFRLELKPSPRSERKSPNLEVEILETMNSHGLRKYMIRRLSCVKTLQHKVPKALKLSPNPARLILECIGMFYTQGNNAYVEGSPLITKRRAFVLLLECFLKMRGEVEGEGGVFEIEYGVKEEAEQAALAWYRRINFEGGILKAQEIDARGLLLLIGCFGIPQPFRNEDIKDLLHQSYIKMISGSLKKSSVLIAKIQEIIEVMLEQNKIVEAVYFTLCFGLEDRFNPQRLLTSYLHESEVSLLNKINRFGQMKGSQDSVQEIIGAKRRYLGGLKSVIQCLGRNNIDHSKLLPEWQIGSKVISLEREIAELRKRLKGDQSMVQKRKIDETEWFSNKEVKHSHIPNPWPLQQQRVVNHVDRDNTLLEGGGSAGYIYGHYVYPSLLHGPAAGSIHENGVGLLAGSVGGVAVAGPGADISANVSGIHAGVPAGTDVLSQVDGSRGDATVYDRLPSHRYACRPSSYLEGPTTMTGDAYSRPPPYMENSKGLPNAKPGDFIGPPPYLEGSAGLPNAITGDVYRPPPYLGGSTGLPNTVPPPYQFADTGPATELYRSSGSQAVDVVPSSMLAHPSSSLYWQR